MKIFEIKALGLEDLNQHEILVVDGGLIPTTPIGGTKPVLEKVIKDSLDWITGFCKGLFS